MQANPTAFSAEKAKEIEKKLSPIYSETWREEADMTWRTL